MSSPRSGRPAPRERLLTTATELFARHGIRAVGIDRILRESAVAKASLYNGFGSKDELVVAYLRAMDARDRALWAERTTAVADPRRRILALFDLARLPVHPAPPGSCHLAAAIEFPQPVSDGERAIRAAVDEQRAWILDTTRAELRALGLQDPENVDDLAARLAILLDGAVVAARLAAGSGPDAAPSAGPAVSARGMAELVLDLVTGPR